MALSGPIVVVADELSAVRDALARGGNLPVRHASAAQAAATIAATRPSAVVLAFETPDPGTCARATGRRRGRQLRRLASFRSSRWYPTMCPPIRSRCRLRRRTSRRASCRACAPRCGCARCTPRCCAASSPWRRRRRARHRRLRSDRGRDRAGRRARPQLSGAHRRDRRAHGPDRRARRSRPRAAISARATSTAW